MQNFIFDSHAHYDDEAFEEDRHQVIQSLRQKGVCNVINVGANLERSKDSIALAAQYPFIYAAAGIHPGDVKDAPADYQEPTGTTHQTAKSGCCRGNRTGLSL